jgi:acetoin utilization deacetylase AcuC-like enzyme
VKIITDENCANYSHAGHPERPMRITGTLVRLRAQKELRIQWLAPTKATDEQILCAHTAAMLARLQVPQDFDNDTPYYQGIPNYAYASVAAALDAMKVARTGQPVFSLMRPPGHHATRDKAMGFCYLNNIAIAVLEALGTGAKRVAVFDFDVHHGNGTEDILLNRPGAAFYSVHQSPCYPGTGLKNAGNNCFNYPVAPSTPREIWRATLTRAMVDMVDFAPQLIAVSAGFDAYERDPLANGTLTIEDFFWLGRQLRATGIPFFSVLEGGYSDNLPELIFAYLKGIES